MAKHSCAVCARLHNFANDGNLRTLLCELWWRRRRISGVSQMRHLAFTVGDIVYRFDFFMGFYFIKLAVIIWPLLPRLAGYSVPRERLWL